MSVDSTNDHRSQPEALELPQTQQPALDEGIKFALSQVATAEELSLLDIERLVLRVKRGLPEQANTQHISATMIECTASMASVHPVYDTIAGKLALKELYIQTPSQFSEMVEAAVSSIREPPSLSAKFIHDARQLYKDLDWVVDESRDNKFSLSALRALETTYLLRDGNGRILERPQFMYMRVAVALHGNDLARVIETYELLSRHYFTHASPTLFHAGTPRGQLSSCFLLPLNTDSIHNVFRTLKECADISCDAGGIGLSVNTYPSAGGKLGDRTTSGLQPLLAMFDSSIALTDQGTNKRPGAMTVYVEPWHADIFTFLDLKRSRGISPVKARRLFYALWVPDIFMQRVENDAYWTLFDPADVPRLTRCYGKEFEQEYIAYEQSEIPRTSVPARNVWSAILDSQIETSGPFMLYKDSINSKSNQQHIGPITHSNLCTEIMQLSSEEETAVCTLASLILPTFVSPEGTFDYLKLHHVVKTVVRNLNAVLDNTFCPTDNAAFSNQTHRAIGVGVQGLADTFLALRFPYESTDARELNIAIAEVIHFAALEASCELSEEFGPYSSYGGSPTSRGQLQFDMWGVKPAESGLDWEGLRERIGRHGLRNSLLVAYMPTAGTSQITGCSDGTEPFMSNIYSRRVLSGEIRFLSAPLVKDLTALGLWSNTMRERIMSARGSIQTIPEIPGVIKELYKTIWEVRPRSLIDMAIDRAPFTCQSQSLSIYLDDPTPRRLSNIHFYTWRNGLKTGMYYLRTRNAADPIPFTLPVEVPSDHIPHETCLNDTPTDVTGMECESCSA